MPRDTAKSIIGYHAHIYYTEGTKSVAAVVREHIGELFDVRLGRWHDQPVGPHPISMYQVAFSVSTFAKLVPWLMINRQGLDILVHPETGDDLQDHTENAIWLGEKQPLNLAMFQDA
jgi:DOPA 4,5-dioxygenase